MFQLWMFSGQSFRHRIALTALDAKIVTSKRTVDAQTFFTADATKSTLLDPDEVVTEIQIPKPQEGTQQKYLKFTLRTPIDFPIVSVASVITTRRGVCVDARIALGSVAPEPVRATAAEKVIIGSPSMSIVLLRQPSRQSLAHSPSARMLTRWRSRKRL